MPCLPGLAKVKNRTDERPDGANHFTEEAYKRTPS
ncbi:hypothetical protein CBM2626_B110322 [Cupriavidus taiwanensis]|uniref:Uncharacterized protein n=1 Tax=Cupriavidus taiwanensis TaxID=164546 RepID=A0A976B0B5_9BURK|nr:hypothetical protein CBM2614_B150062 [Cupriavidus taiwanensis]SOZ64213.1 hypothetical protein CBM2615_B140119 [Cupriavidus taiwanensis]SOZ67980.1 hypothetical protein CBM2613_B110120 [Cupriavidus taiwanensis]SPA01380.1 hypothetical protein CBM2626_B110322 [Cupriavidus taiwanensis]SPA07845.1 hypothetical protein CBM2625_B110120 [Cupriavidus taiwanensis]